MFKQPLLMSEGTSDKAIIPILQWLMQTHFPTSNDNIQRVNFYKFPKQMVHTLEDKLRVIHREFDFDLLFIHMDADNTTLDSRVQLIRERVEHVRGSHEGKHVPVIPVQTMETWLLVDEKAIIEAAGNSIKNVRLNMPSLNSLEGFPSTEAKSKLHELLEKAANPRGGRRRRERYRPERDVHSIAEFMEDYTVLRNLSAFQHLENMMQRLKDE